MRIKAGRDQNIFFFVEIFPAFATSTGDLEIVQIF